MKTMKSSKILTYRELAGFKTFEERFRYLALHGSIGEETYGFDRWVNQRFYHSPEWKQVRDLVIIRDNACDLGVSGHEIYGKIIIHHMNPILLKDIEFATDFLLNPEYLITTIHTTHNAIHYGDESLLPKDPVDRSPNDTCPWKMQGDKP